MQKTIIIITFLFLFAMLLSCSTKIETEVVQNSTSISGPLGNNLEIIAGSYKVTKSKSYGQDWEIKVKIKNKVPMNFTEGDVALFLDLTDEKGMPISDFSGFSMGNKFNYESVEVDRFKQLIFAPVGTEEWITLYKSTPKEVKELSKQIVKFSMTSKAEIKETASSNANNHYDLAGTYSGSINNQYQITMNITDVVANNVKGSYNYNGKNQSMLITGNIDNNNSLTLTENFNGKMTGKFIGRFDGFGSISGDWINPDGSKKFPFSVTKQNSMGGDVSNAYEGSNSENASSSDCDQFIRDYEAFADSYIRIMKRYKQNPSDMSILNEYNEISQKASNMQTKASNCTDTKYTSKLMSIANRLATALQ